MCCGPFYEFGNGVYASRLHGAIDGCRTNIERAAKDERETQHVVDLVRVVRATGRNDGIWPDLGHSLGHDFRYRVRQREDQRVWRHFADHISRQNAGGGQAKKHVSVGNYVIKRPRFCFLCKAGLERIHVFFAPDMDHALNVDKRHSLDRQAEINEQVQASQACCTATRRNQLH